MEKCVEESNSTFKDEINSLLNWILDEKIEVGAIVKKLRCFLLSSSNSSCSIRFLTSQEIFHRIRMGGFLFAKNKLSFCIAEIRLAYLSAAQTCMASNSITEFDNFESLTAKTEHFDALLGEIDNLLMTIVQFKVVSNDGSVDVVRNSGEITCSTDSLRLLLDLIPSFLDIRYELSNMNRVNNQQAAQKVFEILLTLKWRQSYLVHLLITFIDTSAYINDDLWDNLLELIKSLLCQFDRGIAEYPDIFRHCLCITEKLESIRWMRILRFICNRVSSSVQREVELILEATQQYSKNIIAQLLTQSLSEDLQYSKSGVMEIWKQNAAHDEEEEKEVESECRNFTTFGISHSDMVLLLIMYRTSKPFSAFHDVYLLLHHSLGEQTISSTGDAEANAKTIQYNIVELLYQMFKSYHLFALRERPSTRIHNEQFLCNHHNLIQLLFNYGGKNHAADLRASALIELSIIWLDKSLHNKTAPELINLASIPFDIKREDIGVFTLLSVFVLLPPARSDILQKVFLGYEENGNSYMYYLSFLNILVSKHTTLILHYVNDIQEYLRYSLEISSNVKRNQIFNVFLKLADSSPEFYDFLIMLIRKLHQGINLLFGVSLLCSLFENKNLIVSEIRQVEIVSCLEDALVLSSFGENVIECIKNSLANVLFSHSNQRKPILYPSAFLILYRVISKRVDIYVGPVDDLKKFQSQEIPFCIKEIKYFEKELCPGRGKSTTKDTSKLSIDCIATIEPLHELLGLLLLLEEFFGKCTMSSFQLRSLGTVNRAESIFKYFVRFFCDKKRMQKFVSMENKRMNLLQRNASDDILEKSNNVHYREPNYCSRLISAYMLCAYVVNTLAQLQHSKRKKHSVGNPDGQDKLAIGEKKLRRCMDVYINIRRQVCTIAAKISDRNDFHSGNIRNCDPLLVSNILLSERTLMCLANVMFMHSFSSSCTALGMNGFSKESVLFCLSGLKNCIYRQRNKFDPEKLIDVSNTPRVINNFTRNDEDFAEYQQVLLRKCFQCIFWVIEERNTKKICKDSVGKSMDVTSLKKKKEADTTVLIHVLDLLWSILKSSTVSNLESVLSDYSQMDIGASNELDNIFNDAQAKGKKSKNVFRRVELLLMDEIQHTLDNNLSIKLSLKLLNVIRALREILHTSNLFLDNCAEFHSKCYTVLCDTLVVHPILLRTFITLSIQVIPIRVMSVDIIKNAHVDAKEGNIEESISQIMYSNFLKIEAYLSACSILLTLNLNDKFGSASVETDSDSRDSEHSSSPCSVAEKRNSNSNDMCGKRNKLPLPHIHSNVCKATTFLTVLGILEDFATQHILPVFIFCKKNVEICNLDPCITPLMMACRYWQVVYHVLSQCCKLFHQPSKWFSSLCLNRLVRTLDKFMSLASKVFTGLNYFPPHILIELLPCLEQTLNLGLITRKWVTIERSKRNESESKKVAALNFKVNIFFVHLSRGILQTLKLKESSKDIRVALLHMLNLVSTQNSHKNSVVERREKKNKTLQHSKDKHEYRTVSTLPINAFKKKRRRLRSRNEYIDDCLREEDGNDNFADLEDFLVD